MKKILKSIKDHRIVILISVFLGFAFFIFNPTKTKSANLTDASGTLSNPRLSYKAGVASGSSGASLVTIDSSGNPDNDTNHVFPSDTFCFAPSTLVGCRDNTAYSIVDTPSTTTLDVNPILGSTLDSADFAIATQSGTLALTFTLATDIPATGDIYITIPMADNTTGNDYFPDSSGTDPSTGGFDIGGIDTTNVSVTESCDGTFSVASVTVGSGTTDHKILINNSTGTCASGSTIIVDIGDTSEKLINPAPVTSGRTRGQGENYTINIKTRDGSDNTLDNSDVLIAPVEAVLVSATIDETLTFRICGVKTDLSTQESTCFSTPATVCGQASLNSASYAYSVPFGTLTSTDTFYNTAQYLKVSTNASSGYNVKVRETDQLGKDGVECTYSGAEDETVNCIKDTTCDGATCDHTAANVDDWVTNTYNGFGYSLDSVTGAPAVWEYDSSTDGTCAGSGFCAAQFADTENSQTAVSVMSESGPVDSDDLFVCYRMDISPTQPAGYYYNKVKYTVVPIF